MSTFIKEFQTPRLVIHEKTMKKLGVCLGARVFEDGSIAVLRRKGITLYDVYGRKKEDGLKDVYVFSDGSMVKKLPKDSDWGFYSSTGEFQKKVLNVRILEKRLGAFYLGPRTWELFSPCSFLYNGAGYKFCYYDDFYFYESENENGIVFALTKDGITTLEYRLFPDKVSDIDYHATPPAAVYKMRDVLDKARFGQVERCVENLSSYVRLLDKQFVVSDVPMTVAFYGDVFIDAHPRDRGHHTITLLDSSLVAKTDKLYRIISFCNNTSLQQKADNSWDLVCHDGTVLRSGLGYIHLNEHVSDGLCNIFGCDKDGEAFTLKLRHDGLFYLLSGKEERLLSPTGKKFVAGDVPVSFI